MIERKKKLRLIQFTLLLIGLAVIIFTYTGTIKNSKEVIVSKETQEKIKKQALSKNSKDGDIFYNIEYTGLDLSGNRYILKSKEAYSNKLSQEIVNMTSVEAFFYFKDNTILKLFSNKGIYNNKTLDMSFYNNVKAFYQNSELFSEKAEYSNSKGYLIVSGNVKVKDIKGTIVADELLFDIKKQTLDIESFDDKINANINIK